jgi:prevent-host-death family protein
MAQYGVAEAKNGLPGLIDKALAGEEVVISRHGKPVVEVRPMRRGSEADIAAATERLHRRTAHLPRLKVPGNRFYEWLYDEDEG